jgi:hypothetical protein
LVVDFIKLLQTIHTVFDCLAGGFSPPSHFFKYSAAASLPPSPKANANAKAVAPNAMINTAATILLSDSKLKKRNRHRKKDYIYT